MAHLEENVPEKPSDPRKDRTEVFVQEELRGLADVLDHFGNGFNSLVNTSLYVDGEMVIKSIIDGDENPIAYLGYDEDGNFGVSFQV